MQLAFAPGEPAGIGPDLAILLAQHPARAKRVLAVADPSLLAARAALLGLPFRVLAASDTPSAPGDLAVHPVPTRAPARPGVLDPANAAYVLQCLDEAVKLCRGGVCGGLLTGPVHKGVIAAAGQDFRGHTDYLARAFGIARPVMMLLAGSLRVALATTHLALAEVPRAIRKETLAEVLRVTLDGMRRFFALERPRIMVLGLNPHAGEGGLLGREEIEVIAPVVGAFAERGEAVFGPVAADTAFIPARLARCDAVLAMYHDQGLPVLKYAGFGRAVNLTLGLPVPRVSVDHGVALELAGSGQADPGSLIAALELGLALVREPGRR